MVILCSIIAIRQLFAAAERQDRAQHQTQHRAHQHPVIRRQQEGHRMRRDPEKHDRLRDERTPHRLVQFFQEFRAAHQTLLVGTNNPINCAKATINGLSRLMTAEQIAALRGKTVEEILGKEAQK